MIPDDSMLRYAMFTSLWRRWWRGNRRGSISPSPVSDHRVALCRGLTEAPEVAPAIIDTVCGMAWSASAPRPFVFGGFTDGREGWKSGFARPDLS